MSWNINNLCGLSSNISTTTSEQCAAPERIADVIRSSGADIIVLQEALAEPKDYDDKACEASCERMQRLDVLLQDDGYLVFRSDHAQPVLIASRVPVLGRGSFNLDENHEWIERLRSSPGKLKRDANGTVCVTVNESRPILYAELSLGAYRLGLFGAHFHHTNYVDTADGVRISEARTLLSKILEHSSLDGVLVAADFNQPRMCDQPVEEWKIVREAFKRFKQPEDDGVAGLLQKHGFIACWDLAAARNFPGSGAPPLTHWTGTTVDFVYTHMQKRWFRSCPKLIGTYVFFTDASDHLPVLVDLELPYFNTFLHRPPQNMFV